MKTKWQAEIERREGSLSEWYDNIGNAQEFLRWIDAYEAHQKEKRWQPFIERGLALSKIALALVGIAAVGLLVWLLLLLRQG